MASGASTLRSPSLMLAAFHALREDAGVRWLVAARALTLAGAPLTLWLALTELDHAARAVYLIAVSVATLGPLFEMGPGTLVVQLAVRGPALAAHIHRLAGRWYGIAAIVTAVLAGVGGFVWVAGGDAAQGLAFAAWWTLLSLSAAGYVLLVPSLCIEEGSAGRVAVQRLRAHQAALTLVLLSGGLVIGAGLPAAALAALGVLLLSWHFIRRTRGPHTDPAALDEADVRLSLDYPHRQNRSGLTWLALWAAPQALTPIVYRVADPATAGIVGVHVGLALAPAMLAAAWLHARFPSFGTLAAKGAVSDFDAAVGRTILQAVSAYIFAAICLVCFVLLVQRYVPSAGSTLSLPLVLLLLVGSLAALLTQGMLAWLRAFTEEPLAGSVAIAAILALIGGAIGAWFAGAVGSGLGHAIGSLIGVSLVTVGFTAARSRRLGSGA